MDIVWKKIMRSCQVMRGCFGQQGSGMVLLDWDLLTLECAELLFNPTLGTPVIERRGQSTTASWATDDPEEDGSFLLSHL